MNAVDVAGIFEEMPEEKLPPALSAVAQGAGGGDLRGDGPRLRNCSFGAFSDHELKEVVDELYVDDAVDIVEECPPMWSSAF